jgi:hypothetical protein
MECFSTTKYSYKGKFLKHNTKFDICIHMMLDHGILNFFKGSDEFSDPTGNYLSHLLQY